MADKSELVPSTSQVLSEGTKTASPSESVMGQDKSTYSYSLLFLINLIMFPLGNVLAYLLLPSLARLLLATLFSQNTVRLYTDPRDTATLICGLVYSLPIMFVVAAVIAAACRGIRRMPINLITFSAVCSLTSGIVWYFPMQACLMCNYDFWH